MRRGGEIIKIAVLKMGERTDCEQTIFSNPVEVTSHSFLLEPVLGSFLFACFV